MVVGCMLDDDAGVCYRQRWHMFSSLDDGVSVLV